MEIFKFIVGEAGINSESRQNNLNQIQARLLKILEVKAHQRL